MPKGFQKGHSFYGDLSKPNYFQKGLIPWNKGLKGIRLSPNTEFKKGQKSLNRIDLPKKQLIDLYQNKKLTLKEIAKILNVNKSCVAYNMKRYEIKRRSNSEAHKGKHYSSKTEIKKGQHISPNTEFKKNDSRLIGLNNPNFNNYSSFEQYTPEFNKWLKEQIRQRDNFTCQLCGLIQNDIKLDVHHIDYNKKNSNFNNLITLCRKCHTKTNNSKNKIYWINCFKGLMKK